MFRIGFLGKNPRARGRHRFGWCAAWVIVFACWTALGCSTNAVVLRPIPQNPLAESLQLLSRGGPKPSDRTVQLLRVYNLSDDLAGNDRTLLDKLQVISDREPSADIAHAIAELAFIRAKRTESVNPREALNDYGAAALHAYDYLFDDRFASTRNPYDPQYRGACDLYNASLESAMRILCDRKELVPGTAKTIHTASGAWDIRCELRAARWRPEDFDRFEFVSDYEVKGLKNLYLTHGLGVPLIAVRKSYQGEPIASEYYPAGLSFPVTAFLRPISRTHPNGGREGARNQCVLELYDPLISDITAVDGRPVPLESDLTTPLAYFLSNPEMNLDSSTTGLLNPAELLKRLPGQRPLTGLYMVQPYESGKIPVLMVHGLWSSPMTWMEMFNDLRSQPAIRERYQFWFYLYPTALPFWQSAARLRRDLVKVRHVLDPSHSEPALDQMILIGHSMGGLVSRLQTVDSGEDYWRLVSTEPLPLVKADPKTRQKLEEVFFFQPNPSIRRVITIGTPHRGSTCSNQWTQKWMDKLIDLPSMLIDAQQKLFRDNPGAFPGHSLLSVRTSIDSLSPEMPIFSVMLNGRHAPWVRYHNIVGVTPKDWWISKFTAEGDGVVSYASAHLDDAASELAVPADHTTVHSHPAAVLEVRRILLEHLVALDGRPADGYACRFPAAQPTALR